MYLRVLGTTSLLPLVPLPLSFVSQLPRRLLRPVPPSVGKSSLFVLAELFSNDEPGDDEGEEDDQNLLSLVRPQKNLLEEEEFDLERWRGI